MTVDPPPEEQDTEHTAVFVSEISHINNPGKVPRLLLCMQRELTFIF
jgi:hypothetical protein